MAMHSSILASKKSQRPRCLAGYSPWGTEFGATELTCMALLLKSTISPVHQALQV